jgi:hypothetical protein
MNTELNVIIQLILLTGYCYTLCYAHIFLARLDNRTNLNTGLHASFFDMKKLARNELYAFEPDAKRAIRFIRANRLFIAVFVGFFILNSNVKLQPNLKTDTKRTISLKH